MLLDCDDTGAPLGAFIGDFDFPSRDVLPELDDLLVEDLLEELDGDALLVSRERDWVSCCLLQDALWDDSFAVTPLPRDPEDGCSVSRYVLPREIERILEPFLPCFPWDFEDGATALLPAFPREIGGDAAAFLFAFLSDIERPGAFLPAGPLDIERDR